MLDFQQKRKMRSFLYQRRTLIVLGLIVLLALRSTWVVFSKQIESSQQKVIAEKKVADLYLHDNDLQAKIKNLQTEHGIEQEIRSKYSVAKENENVVIVLDNDTTTDKNSSATTSLWRKFLNLIHIK